MALRFSSDDDILARLTAAGVLLCGDRDGDGEPDTFGANDQTYIGAAGEYAANLVAEAITEFIEPAAAVGNGWLRDREVDIACYRFATNGGREAPECILDDFDMAKEKLEQVGNGKRVPGLVYARPTFSRRRSARGPLTINPPRSG